MKRPLPLVVLATLASAMSVWPSSIGAVAREVCSGPTHQGQIVLRNSFRSSRDSSMHSAMSPEVVSGVSVSATSDGGSAGIQAARIIGRLSDQYDQPIPGATVLVVPGKGGIARSVLSRADGTYEVDGIAEGAYFVDFELTGFDLVRRNNVRATTGTPGHADAVLHPSAMCECVTITPRPSNSRVGQVLSASGYPLPHAILHADGLRPDFGLTDSDGRFALRVPLDGSVALTASESGFESATQQVSVATTEPIVFRLVPRNGTAVPDTERLRAPCCPGDFLLFGRY